MAWYYSSDNDAWIWDAGTYLPGDTPPNPASRELFGDPAEYAFYEIDYVVCDSTVTAATFDYTLYRAGASASIRVDDATFFGYDNWISDDTQPGERLLVLTYPIGNTEPSIPGTDLYPASYATGGTATEPTPPSNDNWADRTVLTGSSGSAAFDHLEWASAETGEDYYPATNNNLTVWYQWTCPADGDYIFDTSDTAQFLYYLNPTGMPAGAPGSGGGYIETITGLTLGDVVHIQLSGGYKNNRGSLTWQADVPAPTLVSLENVTRPGGGGWHTGELGRVHGTNLEQVTGVTFGGVAVPFTIVSPTVLEFTVTSSAPTGALQLHYTGGELAPEDEQEHTYPGPWITNAPIAGSTSATPLGRGNLQISIFEEYNASAGIGGEDFAARCESTSGVGDVGPDAPLRAVAVSQGPGPERLHYFQFGQRKYAYDGRTATTLMHFTSGELVNMPDDAVGVEYEWPDGSVSDSQPPTVSWITALSLTFPVATEHPSETLSSGGVTYDLHDPETAVLEVRGQLGAGTAWTSSNYTDALQWDTGAGLLARPLLASHTIGASSDTAGTLTVPVPVDNIPQTGLPVIALSIQFTNQQAHTRPLYPVEPVPVDAEAWNRGATIRISGTATMAFTYQQPRYRWVRPVPTTTPPIRQYQRDDGLTGGVRSQFQATSRQASLRQIDRSTYL